MQMLPFLVNEFYRWNLLHVQMLYVGGLDWGVKYKQFPGYIYNLEDMIRLFRLKKNETIIFTFNDSDVLYGRIYQSNGVEIDYQYRANHEHDDSTGDSIWSFEETPKSGYTTHVIQYLVIYTLAFLCYVPMYFYWNPLS